VFESNWSSFINDFQLGSNEWFSTRYFIRASWIPAYFMDIPLAGVLRTTSRSESDNSFFNRFIHRKLSFVEFWLRFDIALECQCEEELKADNKSIHTTPKLVTLWPMEKQCGMTYTHEVFQKFQSHGTICKQDEFEAFIGMKIPNEVNIHLPNDIRSKGRCKRIKKSKEMKSASKKRTCGKCKQVGQHDAQNCPNNVI
jgi:hypothetical protein